MILLYPLAVVWPSGWAWLPGAPYESDYFMMIVGLYVTLGAFLWNAARRPEANVSLILVHRGLERRSRGDHGGAVVRQRTPHGASRGRRSCSASRGHRIVGPGKDIRPQAGSRLSSRCPGVPMPPGIGGGGGGGGLEHSTAQSSANHLGRYAIRVSSVRHRPRGPGEEGLFMNTWCMLVLIAAVAATASVVDTAVASADQYIDFGTNQAACKTAANQANAASNRNSYCYQTGPGHYTLYFAN